MWGRSAEIEAYDDEGDARLLQARHEARPGGQADDADEHAQAERVEDPDGRLGNPPEVGVDRPQPAEHEAHHQRAAARGQGERHVPDDDGQQADEAAQEDARADEHHVGRRGLAVRVAERLRRAVHLRQGADDAQDVAAVDAGFR